MPFQLLQKALVYNMDAHRSNPTNLIAGAIGMMMNNIILLIGIWGMLFAEKPENTQLLPYYIALIAVVMTAWGIIHFFLGGLGSLGDLITNGILDPMLATPRHPLLLVSISKSHPVALGDLVIGLFAHGLLIFKVNPTMGYQCLFATVISSLAFASLFIFAGSLSFFIARGNSLGKLLVEITLSLSMYPTGKIFTGAERMILLLTPAAATAIFPLDTVENTNIPSFLIALLAAIGFFCASLSFFRYGVKRYQSVN